MFSSLGQTSIFGLPLKLKELVLNFAEMENESPYFYKVRDFMVFIFVFLPLQKSSFEGSTETGIPNPKTDIFALSYGSRKLDRINSLTTMMNFGCLFGQFNSTDLYLN